MSWSSGKDAALALYRLQLTEREPVSLLVSVLNAERQRVSMHGLSRTLLEKQLAALALPYRLLELPESPSNTTYERHWQNLLRNLKKEGYQRAVFGDIFLQDLRHYREGLLKANGFRGGFPLWKEDTRQLFRHFLEAGFKALVAAVDARVLDQSFLFRELDESFLNDLPPGVDPCGENGEFHTFCYAGPLFQTPVAFRCGEKVYRHYQNGDQQWGSWFGELLEPEKA